MPTTRTIPDGDARYRHLMDQASDAIFVFDDDLRITECNAAALALTGYTHEEIVQMTVVDLMDPEDVVMTPPNYAAIERGSEILLERRIRRRDGSTVIVEAHSRQVARGLWMGIARDLSARKQLEHRVRQAEKLEAIGLLAGGVAHDFNNHLTVIRGHAELLTEETPPTDPRAADIAAIRDAAARAARLTAQLLAFGRRQVLQPRVFDLNDVISELLPMLGRIAGEDIVLSLDLAPAPILLHADPTQVEQVIINLIANARDAIHGNGGAIDLRTSLRPCPHGRPGVRYAVLEIADTGSGMDAATRARLFEPFFTTKPIGQGTGLGLATVYGIVQQSGGQVEVESTLGVGTTMRVILPAPADAVAPRADARTRPWRRGCERVLLVEDDDSVRTMIARVLTRLGYLVLDAPDGRAALTRLAEDDPVDLIIADAVLPGMSGAELTRRVRERSPRTRALYISGYPHTELAHRAIDLRGAPVLSKPFEAVELSDAVRAALDDRGDDECDLPPR